MGGGGGVVGTNSVIERENLRENARKKNRKFRPILARFAIANVAQRTNESGEENEVMVYIIIFRLHNCSVEQDSIIKIINGNNDINL